MGWKRLAKIKGQDGKTPVPGVDFDLPKDGIPGKDGKTPIKGRDYFDGKSIKGDKPKHKWEETKLFIEKPDGKWGKGVDLSGKAGKDAKQDFSVFSRATYPAIKVEKDLLTTGVREFNFENKNLDVTKYEGAKINVKVSDTPEFDTIALDTNYTPTGNEPVGTTYWDDANKTISTVLEGGVIGQHFEEGFITGQNDTGSTLDDGTVATYEGSIGNSGNIRIEHTVASATEPTFITLGIITQDISNGGVGKITTYGKVRGIQTDGANYSETWVDQDILYKSSTVAGGLTNVAPNAPIPAIPIAVVISAHATNGTLLVRPTYPQGLMELTDVNGSVPVADDVLSFDGTVWDSTNTIELDRLTIRGDNVVNRISYPLSGLSALQQELHIVVDGSTVYMETQAVGGGDLPYVFDEEKHVLDCTTGAGGSGKAQIALTTGTVGNPQINYIYVAPNGVGVATLYAGTSFPSGVFAWHSAVVLQDAATVASDGPINIQRTTEALKHGGRGQFSYINEKLRAMGARYQSGCASTLTDGAAMDLSVAAGEIFQKHLQDFPARSVVVDGITVANASGAGTLTENQVINDLNDIEELADGTSIGTNKYFSVSIWATMASSDQSGNRSRLFVNLPTGFYNSESAVIADSNNLDVRSAPPEFQGTAFLVSRVTFKKTSGNHTPVGNEVYSLLGRPMGALGGGAGSTALVEFSDADIKIYDNDAPTRVIDFDAGSITAGNARAIIMADTDVDLAGVLTPTQKTDLTDGGETTLHSHAGGVAGSDTQVQFNDGGVAGADADFTFDKTNGIVETRQFKVDNTTRFTELLLDLNETLHPITGFNFVTNPKSSLITSYKDDAAGVGVFVNAPIMWNDTTLLKGAGSLVGTNFSGIYSGAGYYNFNVTEEAGAISSNSVLKINYSGNNAQSANGALFVNANGTIDGSTPFIAAKTTAINANGNALTIGYRGWAQATGTGTSALIGVEGYTVPVSTVYAAVAIQGNPKPVGSLPNDQLMSFRGVGGHILNYEGSILCLSTAQVRPKDVTTTHLDFLNNTGELYIEGAAEIDGMLYADGGVTLAAQQMMTVGVYSDATRPAAGTAGRMIFNTTDGNLNIDDGTNWILPDGTTT